ncbi:MAG TPA: signal peptidase I [Spirochaetota bacterium]|nr:signal peptidase I [Spirochaetota bacterium]HPJ37749.1 signal peptidase I [Spirochaetota bacterium]HPQ52852.1 signal peptidase I [Spirochaetota bacterium]
MNLDWKRTEGGLTGLAKGLLLAGGILLGIVAARIWIQPYTVSDNSMLPNLREGDSVYCIKHTTPKVGDIVLFESPVEPDKVLLKRVIAGEGDTVEIKDSVVLINGRNAAFSWKIIDRDSRIFPMSFSYRDNYPIIKLKRRQLFLLGDNIDHSMDSRFFGPINIESVIGRLLYKM